MCDYRWSTAGAADGLFAPLFSGRCSNLPDLLQVLRFTFPEISSGPRMTLILHKEVRSMWILCSRSLYQE